ncbi:hypothetical protein C3L33_05450, partial [Rhododendron williamsianum]
MALHHFTDQHLTDNTAVLRGIFPEHSPEGAGKQPHVTGGSGGGGGAPTWLNSAILRQQSGHHPYGGGGGGGGGEVPSNRHAGGSIAEDRRAIGSVGARDGQVLCSWHGNQPLDDKDLDQFMTHYVLLLSSFKEQLQQHVRVHAMEAVMACWELEQSLQSLTGVAPGEGTGATMSDDDDEEHTDGDANLFDGSLDGQDTMGFGPLVLTENERSLMERVRHELKHELKQGYKEKIVDIREEILRKRRAGKLPGDTTSLLKAWWQSHSKWPYPTEEDKARLVQETGLQLKQINNWFINQRKRNWHSNPSSSTTTKSKRKR